ncbi:sensor histidine kinase [Taibaiella chishuiensis]|uniref:histidine kinase n=1 Tax=Taibaiella chishuiensis TaxID=1434707 RepID=A0A2P8DC19_9BACT|nr:HAMP domain-containing sensor histidine kinase [Taibaiella chishuiensis]PSK94762.1 signal transduction histidine kinase [Taibaiella chishuiensis]
MRKIFTLLFLWLPTVLAAQHAFKKEAQQCDSLIGITNNHELEILARKVLPQVAGDDWYNLALFHYYIGQSMEMPANYDTAVSHYEQAIAYARKAKDGALLSRPLRGLVFAYYAAGEKMKLDEVARELEHMSDTTKNQDLRIINNSVLANYYAAKGIHEKQLNYLLEDLAYAQRELAKGKETARFNAYVAEDLIKIAELYNVNLKQPDKSKVYLDKARPHILPADRGASVFYYKLYAEALLDLGQADKANLYYDSLSAMCTGGFGMACNVRITLDLVFIEHMLAAGKQDQARLFLDRAKKLAPEYAQDPTTLSQLQLLEGQVYMAAADYKAALPLLKQAEAGGRLVSLEFFTKVQAALARCSAGLGQWQDAYRYAQENVLLQDSLYLEKTQQGLANAEAKYQNKEKQQQIEQQQVQLSYARKQLWWLVAGLALVLLIAVLLFVIYRNKKRTADLLDHKNKTLARLNHDLEEANQTKAKLFSIISHDLRSPISQVYQFLKLQQLDQNRLTEEQRNVLSYRIQTATGSLLETMEDLLLWSKTQMNQFNTEMQPVSVADVVTDCLQLLQLNSDAKGLRVNNAVAADARVKSDPYFLQAIVRNLLQNAIKAAPEGSVIDIGFTGHTLSIGNDGVHFSQADYETAIAAAQSPKSLSGLGLRLVDELSRKIGATITFADTTGSGTRVALSMG